MPDQSDSRRSLPELEKAILKLWHERRVFQKTLAQTRRGRPFVFFEGPPTANGRPGLHHVLARAWKDAVCRYQTMRGRFVARRAGWDTHGLPVEIQVEKQLGINSKKEIENLVPGDPRASIKFFNQKCRESVWEYKDLWEKLTLRMGYWLDLDDPYVTYDSSYIESLWWLIAEFHRRGLLYQGHKILPWCPRCGTGLSSHEVAQGYQTVTDTSVYVKFKLLPNQTVKGKLLPKNTYLLSWTTTPWTLPGNVALAVGDQIKYASVDFNGHTLIFAAPLITSVLGEKIQPPTTFFTGQDLVGLKYEPLFKIKELVSPQSYQVYSADFVSINEGTGIVHAAVMYGEDDYALGQAVGLPTTHTVDADGRFLSLVPELAGLPAKNPATEKKILNYLEHKNFLFKTSPYQHDYPHCWRCDTPVLYYARSSWFIAMSRLRPKLVKNNRATTWVPAHDKTGRFGSWLKEAKDWAFSRERYWATPLPIWYCSHCHQYEVINSLDELSRRAQNPGNVFYLMRHGEAVSNTTHRLSSYPETFSNPLTPRGRAAVLATAKKLKSLGLDLIISSDLRRAQETASLLAKALGIKKIIYDARLREKDFQSQNGAPAQEEDSTLNEPTTSIRARIFAALAAADRDYQNKKILLVSHGEPLSVLTATASLKTKASLLKTAAFQKLDFRRLPRNDAGELDLHRPFVDEITLTCSTCGQSMSRVPELADVWFDSGAMPFASVHYPFAGRHALKLPADYIAEAVDQTRGWFYTLLAVSTALGRGPAYRHVVSLGHIRDRHGRKMSKSRGNVIEPISLMDTYGADPVRWYLYTLNDAGLPKNFDENDLKKVNQNIFNLLANSLAFWKIYSPKKSIQKSGSVKSTYLLDRWLIARLNQTILAVTAKLDAFDLFRAAKTLELFLDDLSRWYIRRSRSRFQNPIRPADLASASATLRQALLIFSRLLAPFSPFFAEHLYQELGGSRPSVHLESWPRPSGRQNSSLLKSMVIIRELANLALAARERTSLKVRQPLAELKVKTKLSLPSALLNLLKDEINVKKITFGARLGKGCSVALDTRLTPALKEEGNLRELVRFLQGLRAQAGLKPGQLVTLHVEDASPVGSALIKNNLSKIMRLTSLQSIKFVPALRPRLRATSTLSNLGSLTLSLK